MLKKSFCHIPGVSSRLEEQFWSAEIHDWESFIQQPPLGLSPARIRKLVDCLTESLCQLELCNPLYFSKLLPSRQHWRLFPLFRHTTAYLDIETTGLSRERDAITTIALYDGKCVRYYVQGKNLDRFRDDVKDYKLLVTYNGKGFDIPFIETCFDISLPQAHIDLMHVLRSLGFKGGLKGCEKQLGLDRGELEGVDGYLAVLLWRDYQRCGNTKALETLLAYNIEDAVNLETLMVAAYNMKLEATPCPDRHYLQPPGRPEIPFKADQPTIDRHKNYYR